MSYVKIMYSPDSQVSIGSVGMELPPNLAKASKQLLALWGKNASQTMKSLSSQPGHLPKVD